MSMTLKNFDGQSTDAQVEGPLDPRLPLVVLLHGLGGSSGDMTDPLTSRPGTAFVRSGRPRLYIDQGFHPFPPVFPPITDIYLDPPATALSSWQQALLAAGFSTVTYSMKGPLIAGDAGQLKALAAGPLSTQSELKCMRIAFVAHSRGGLVARAFLTAATTDPALVDFLTRTKSLITMHSPHLGSGVASLGATIDGLLASVQLLLKNAVSASSGFLADIRSMVLDPSIAELIVGSPTASIAPGEPVAGISYHTFGGTSTAFAQLWANVYTPDSFVPWPVPFPVFHWGTTPLLAGLPLDAASFIPLAAVFAPSPEVTTLAALLAALAASTPELAPGSGDLLVTDARSRLPFSASHTTNWLNHAEALWDPTLQSQVISILSRLRTPPVSGKAVSWLYALYADLLGRAPDPGGLAYWLGQLDAGRSPQCVAYGFLRSQEYCTSTITGLYEQLLDRQPDAAGLAFWVTIMGGGTSLQQIILGFCDSAEYRGNNPPPGQFVDSLYQRLLNRAPDPAGRQGWIDALAAGRSTADVINGFLASQEYCANRVTSLYQTLLGRQPDPAGLAGWVASMTGGAPFQDIQQGFLTSTEYEKRALTRLP